MTDVKYVAAGFLHDAKKLLEDFVRENNKKFSVFADIWRKHNFSLIYMGRRSEEELKEFTQEIFHLSLKFVNSRCSMLQVGGIYLLYALYRNQILKPPVRIRVVLDQLKAILDLRNASIAEGNVSFHYVVSYLVLNSFDFMACPKPMGPTTSTILKEDHERDDKDGILGFHAGLKVDMTELAESNALKETGDMFVEYAEMKKTLNVSGMVSDTTGPFKEYVNRLESIVGPSSKAGSLVCNKNPVTGDIGSRRVMLKKKAFGASACPESKTGQVSYEDNNNDSDLDLPVVPPYPLRRRILKPRRNVGRPKKVIKAEEESDDSLHRRRRRRKIKKANRKAKTSTRHYYSDGKEMKVLPNYENLKIFPNVANRKLFTDSEVDDPEPAIALLDLNRKSPVDSSDDVDDPEFSESVTPVVESEIGRPNVLEYQQDEC